MLDTATKKRIDDCRNILVGKLPDPKAQIEQITIGLIYKFMDDMDKEAIELGGTAKFFLGEYEKYNWKNLFDSKVTATEMLGLYSSAIVSMDKNPNIPQLFRNIFKNAYLPYRDPETLKMFLKTIGEFEYAHSEMLGDAFEYLLSIMGSQGDAGQFRTPRHIIDFLVAVVDPQKTDTILDPACGTAGFLISAYNHIREKNHQQLTPDEQKRLINNFSGYDISPDMVRLSLVNLFLHNFSNPNIWEYDTLSSEERWNESFDVVLANPPFMSPKGGIRPHKKFSISSNRSEVLFVDYIAEHLNSKGRAGIIVPEGVIFQSGTAYKDLRKMLVENYLYAVISLPAGIFNPYSGVKTSILLMDKELSKTNDTILFVKVDNDGFNLGAQRNAVKGGQLKEAIKIVKQFKAGAFEKSEMAHAVSKTVIAQKGDYNLTGERYKNTHIESKHFSLVHLDDIVEVKGGKRLPKDSSYSENKTAFPYIRVADFNEVGINLDNIKYLSKEIQSQISNYTINKEDVYISIAGTIGVVGIIPDELDGANLTENAAKLVITNKSKVNNRYLALILRTENSKSQILVFTHAVGVQKLALTRIKQIQIPLPPLSLQEEIVAEIVGYQKIIDGAKMVVENYKPKIEIDPEWKMVELGEACEMNPKKSELTSLSGTLEVSFVPMADMNENQIDFKPVQIKPLGEVIKGYTYFKEDDVLLAKVTPCFENGKAGIAKGLVNGIGFGSSEYYVFRPNEKILSTWIYLNVITENFRINGKLNMTGTGGLQRVPKDFIAKTLIPLPPIDIQRQIVTQIEKEIDLVNANKELIGIFEQKIKDRIAKVWGETTESAAPKSLKGDFKSGMRRDLR